MGMLIIGTLNNTIICSPNHNAVKVYQNFLRSIVLSMQCRTSVSLMPQVTIKN